MFKVTRRVYRTNDGRLVEEGDLQAAFLAYAVGDEVSDSEARRVGLTAFGEKARAKAATKPAGGVTINRARKEQADA